MKNPLNKRFKKEFINDFYKYFVIFILLVGTIGFVSGFLVADGSMLQAYNESFDKYNIEDGHFTVKKKLSESQKKKIEDLGIKLYDLNYKTIEANNSKIRIYKNRDQVNKVCLMKGSMPNNNEIALDRMYAQNNNLNIGDTIKNNEIEYKISGFVALSDYSCLFENNSDTMFDSLKFCVAIVSDETYDNIDKLITYNYAFLYNHTITNEQDESEQLMKDIAKIVSLEDFVPQYLNQAIHFTGEDMGSDKAMMVVLLYILIVIIAFVFSVITENTIIKEANVIGTLRASGYTKKELIIHYMTLPMLITLISAIIGNICGYTFMKNICVTMYYNSYSLPTYITIFNSEAFLLTSVVPFVLMLIINYILLKKKLELSPLKLLRRDLKKKQQKKVLPLSKKIRFITRFRIRIIIQNISNYIVIFFGILFANLLLFFGLGMPSLLNEYQQTIENNLICNYQYILSLPSSVMTSDSQLEKMMSMFIFSNETQTETKDAEKFTAYSLVTTYKQYNEEEITLYGIQENSQYINLDTKDKVYISKAYQEKYLVNIGDTIVLKEKYEDDSYSFKVDGIYDYEGALCIVMDKDALNKTLDLDNSYFSGYFSNSKIEDINEKYISTCIDIDTLTKVSRQLTQSMGEMMYLVQAIAVIIYMIIIYLLSKVIIEKNAQSISMTKILGYNDIEISRLYILSTSFVVLLSLLTTLPLVYLLFKMIYRPMMIEMMSGWIPLLLNNIIYIKIFILGISTYIIIAYLEYQKIRKIPKEEALKNVE